MEGWIKIHQQIVHWEWFDSPNVFCLFIHLLLMANWRQAEWHGNTLMPGQLVAGREKLAEETGLSVQQIRTSLKKLQNTGEITIKSTNKYSIITITNYDRYQVTETESNQQTNQQLTNNQPTTNHNRRIIDNKTYKEENINKRRKFVEPTLDEVQDYCQSRNNGVDAEYFISYYQSCGWMVGRNHMKDWKAAIRTWERNNRNNNSMSLDSRRGTDAPKRPNYEQGL